jgi:hypothetical protein
MGRLTKQGIDYFPLDVQFDDKSELYLIEKEAVGLAVMITLWQIIYQNEGYFINNSSDLHLLIKRRINVNINDINDCINAMLKRGILDARLYEKHGILTSKAIQKRYFDAAKRKKEVRVIRAFIVTNLDSYTNLINVDINNIDVDINGINVGGNATKEEEEEEGKEEEEVTPPPPAPKNPCPVSKIVALYHGTLPGLATVQKISNELSRKIKARWNADTDRQSLEWWQWYFEGVCKCGFLMGQKKDWAATLHWLTGRENMEKVLSGYYLDRNRTTTAIEEFINEPA